MIVHVCPPRKEKQRVKVFKYNCVNRNKKVVQFLMELSESKKEWELYKRGRGNNKYDIAIHVK